MKDIKYLFLGSLLCFVYLMSQSYSVQAQKKKKYPKVDTMYAGIEKIEVNGRFCRVQIEIVENTDKVILQGEIRGFNRKDRFEIMHEKLGTTLKVWIDDLSENSITLATKSRLTFKMPAKVELDVKNTSGGIYAAGLKGPYHRLRTSSGMIKLQNVKAQELRLRTTSGGIRLQDIQANVKATSSAGMVKVTRLKGSLYTRTSAGGIRLKDIEGGLSLKSSAGAIIGEQVLLTENSDFRSSAGKIRMKFKNDLKELNFDLRSSAAKLYIGEERFKRRVVLSNGKNILVKGTSSAGSQKYEKAIATK